MAKLYDIAIIGAGPAGLCAALEILKHNKKIPVIIIEKKSDTDQHIPCAEGVGKLGFHEVIKPAKTWIRLYVNKLTLHSPDNTTITYTDKGKGYILNRTIMQKDLADLCVKKGAEFLFNHKVIKLSKPDTNRIRSLFLKNEEEIHSRVVIDCSGSLSRFGKNENINYKPHDLEIAYFAHVENVEVKTNTVHLFMNQKLAPGGYAWAFPRNNQSLNIGIVLGSSFRGKHNIKILLDSFLKEYYPEAVIVRKCAGTIPCYTKKKVIATYGLIKAGDAISIVNPISRAGICEAMKSGTLAGHFAVKMLYSSSDTEEKKICKMYEKAWHKKLGRVHQKLALVKKIFQKVPDRNFNNAAHTLQKIPQEKLTMSKIFTTAVGNFPKLLLALRHLI